MPTTTGYRDPYDNRIGAGGLPSGIFGSANRAYVGQQPGNQSSFGLVNRYTASSSPMIRQAENKAANQAASRGLLNSSIAAGAGRAAAIDAAGQFASQDSAQNTQLMLKNIDVLNEQAGNQAMADMQRTMSGAFADANNAQAEMDRQTRLQLQREALAFEGEQGQLGRIHEADIGRQGYGFQRGLNEQNYGYDLGRMETEYGYDLGRGAQQIGGQRALANDQYGYNRGLADQEYQYGMRREFMNNVFRDDPAFRDPETVMAQANFFFSPDYTGRSSYLSGGY